MNHRIFASHLLFGNLLLLLGCVLTDFMGLVEGGTFMFWIKTLLAQGAATLVVGIMVICRELRHD